MHAWINVDAGIFMSYVGLFSYYNFDNWAYQPSMFPPNTPWFFNGCSARRYSKRQAEDRAVVVMDGQSYGRFNNRPGVGGQILWRRMGAADSWKIICACEDVLNTPGRVRYHTDDSIQYKYYDNPMRRLSKPHFPYRRCRLEHGGGLVVQEFSEGPKQSFLGFML